MTAANDNPYAYTPETMSDTEAAARLGYHIRPIRKVVAGD